MKKKAIAVSKVVMIYPTARRRREQRGRIRRAIVKWIAWELQEELPGTLMFVTPHPMDRTALRQELLALKELLEWQLKKETP